MLTITPDIVAPEVEPDATISTAEIAPDATISTAEKSTAENAPNATPDATISTTDITPDANPDATKLIITPDIVTPEVNPDATISTAEIAPDATISTAEKSTAENAPDATPDATPDVAPDANPDATKPTPDITTSETPETPDTPDTRETYMPRSQAGLMRHAFVQVGLVVAGRLDPTLLEAALRRLVRAWPLLGGVQLMDTTPLRLTCGAEQNIDFATRRIAQSYPQLFERRYRYDPPPVGRGDAEFHWDAAKADAPTQSVLALRVTVLDDATLLGWRVSHYIANAAELGEVLRAFALCVDGKEAELKVLTPSPDAVEGGVPMSQLIIGAEEGEEEGERRDGVPAEKADDPPTWRLLHLDKSYLYRIHKEALNANGFRHDPHEEHEKLTTNDAIAAWFLSRSMTCPSPLPLSPHVMYLPPSRRPCTLLYPMSYRRMLPPPPEGTTWMGNTQLVMNLKFRSPPIYGYAAAEVRRLVLAYRKPAVVVKALKALEEYNGNMKKPRIRVRGDGDGQWETWRGNWEGPQSTKRDKEKEEAEKKKKEEEEEEERKQEEAERLEREEEERREKEEEEEERKKQEEEEKKEEEDRKKKEEEKKKKEERMQKAAIWDKKNTHLGRIVVVSSWVAAGVFTNLSFAAALEPGQEAEPPPKPAAKAQPKKEPEAAVAPEPDAKPEAEPEPDLVAAAGLEESQKQAEEHDLPSLNLAPQPSPSPPPSPPPQPPAAPPGKIFTWPPPPPSRQPPPEESPTLAAARLEDSRKLVQERKLTQEGFRRAPAPGSVFWAEPCWAPMGRHEAVVWPDGDGGVFMRAWNDRAGWGGFWGGVSGVSTEGEGNVEGDVVLFTDRTSIFYNRIR
ncbi:hypothetical protein EDC01DRAFT_516310 [Geopyxis carbonaria]|nr:hypothetical protein EDC01DRAFT_516310 [Geopyxis carbonaria]